MRPKLKLVKIDETHYWSDLVVESAGRLWGVYLYDENVHVHCAEWTASYECHFLYTVTENEVDDETDRMIEEGDMFTDPIRYFHVSDIKADYDCKGWRIKDYANYDEMIEAAVEYYRNDERNI